MKIVFTTNIDAYNEKNCFPHDFPLTMIPRNGDMVEVKGDLHSYYRGLKLPIRLEVTRVTWTETMVICELWYNEADKKASDIAGGKTL